MTDNPLFTLGVDGPRLPFDRIEVAHVRPAIDGLLEASRAALQALGAHGGTSYDAVLGALDRATEPLSRAMGLVSHLESVMTTPELRAVVNEVRPKVSEHFAAIPLDPAIWRALRDYAATPDAASLTGAHARHLHKTLDEFRRAGADLDAAGKERLLAIDVELSRVTTKFAEHVLDATNAWDLVIQDASRLAGLPPSALEGARASAEAKGLSGYRFTLQAPSVMGVLTYLDDASIREIVWRAYNTRASGGELDNAPLVERTLALRTEKARILGKRDFADLVLEDRMAKDGATAAKFVDELEARTQPFFAAEKAELEAFRRELEGSDAPPLAPWDVGYYTEKLRQKRFDFDEESLRPYFAAERVLDGLFALASQLYGVRFAPLADAPTWHPSVRVFQIEGEGGTQLGVFHVDLYPREQKRGGAWMNSLIMGGPTASGAFAPHVGLFCANATPPLGDRPALLTHDEVETLFHEFGHLLHQLLSRVEVPSLAGTNVAWDFVELPSQIMENWTWERAALDLFARHVDTGEPIPAELMARKTKARTFRAATMQMRQLGFAALDLKLHREYALAGRHDLLAYARETMAPFAATALPPDYAMITAFTHLFASPVGYAAAYYSYKWAEVLDADAFGRFRREGVLSPEVGRAFRDRILARGDADDAMTLFVDFMGRPPSLDALLERSGLVAASA